MNRLTFHRARRAFGFYQLVFVFIVASLLSGCLGTIFMGPSLEPSDATRARNTEPAPDEEKDPVLNSGDIKDALLFAERTRKAFDGLRSDYVKANRTASGLLSTLGFAGAVAAGYDASVDVLKGLGFGAAGTLVFEDFANTQHGGEVLKAGLAALDCAVDQATGIDGLILAGVTSNSTGFNAFEGVEQRAHEIFSGQQKDIQVELVTRRVPPSDEQMGRLSQLIRMQKDLSDTIIADTIAHQSALAADGALDSAKNAAGMVLWNNVRDMRREVVHLLTIDVVDLGKIFESTLARTTELQSDLLAKMKKLKEDAKKPDPKTQLLAVQAIVGSDTDKDNFALWVNNQNHGIAVASVDSFNGFKTLAAKSEETGDSAAAIVGKLQAIIDSCKKKAT